MNRIIKELYLQLSPTNRFFTSLYYSIFGIPLMGKRYRYGGARKLLKKYDIGEGKKILDFGTGIADFAIEMQLLTGATVYANDLDEERYRIAKKLCHKNKLGVKFINQNLLGKKAYKGTFDCIVALDVLEHVKEDKKLLKQLGELLTPNGVLLLSTPTPFRTTNPKFEKSIGHVRIGYSKPILEKLAFKVGLSVDYFRYFDPWDVISKYYRTENPLVFAITFPFYWAFSHLGDFISSNRVGAHQIAAIKKHNIKKS